MIISEEATGDWRKLRSKKIHNLLSSVNIRGTIKSSRMLLAGHVACIGKMINTLKILDAKYEWKSPTDF